LAEYSKIALVWFGDAIKFKRIELYEKHVHKTKENLKNRGIDWERDGLKTVSPKIAIPAFERASLEDDDDLHTLCSNLLANAMDPNFKGDIKSRHVAILKELEPLDLRVLSTCYTEKMANHERERLDEVLFDKIKIVESFGQSEQAVEVSILNLMRLGCVKGGNIITHGLTFGDMPNTVYTGTNRFTISMLGVELCRGAMSK